MQPPRTNDSSLVPPYSRYQETSEYPTGKCAVLITGHDRSLVTNLEAANHFTVDHLDAAENWAVVSCAFVVGKNGSRAVRGTYLREEINKKRICLPLPLLGNILIKYVYRTIDFVKAVIQRLFRWPSDQFQLKKQIMGQ